MSEDRSSEPKLTGFRALRSISRAAGMLARHRHDRHDRHGGASAQHNEPRKLTRAGGAGGTLNVELVNGKLLQTIHGISLIQVSQPKISR